MHRNTLRMAAVSALTAVTLGAGAGLAQASPAAPVRPAATQATLSASEARALLGNSAFTAELTAKDAKTLRAVADGKATRAQSSFVLGGAARGVIALMRKHGGKLWSGAVSAAKKGWGKFHAYMNGLAWYHPVRVAYVAAGGEVQYQIFKYLHSLM